MYKISLRHQQSVFNTITTTTAGNSKNQSPLKGNDQQIYHTFRENNSTPLAEPTLTDTGSVWECHTTGITNRVNRQTHRQTTLHWYNRPDIMLCIVTRLTRHS